ncbi:SDR family oxidoreductase [Xinfangfangia sp. D13-10-4-6]|uniref:SDR family NAD(P)-dependent oxidoreductase n=1 Tax=Pseudogemmobacter hezensis TaxID=2737662 RepID=UPI0015565093|nr:SDR family NAD(P)-dependent oxidoreductase [Pseudogemmobacter hezensis]NPD16054.1 SDR family oxidoreductase [Pseudogemmobacter hezensis]
MELTGKTALVTGAAGGIGRAIALGLLDAGADVIACDRDAAALQSLVDQNADQYPGKINPMVVDLGDAEALTKAAEAIAGGAADGTAGGVDILVNNAGILSPHKLAATTLEEFHRIMAVNLDAALILTKAFVPGMKAKGWGRLINIASYAWKSGGLTAGTSYAISKAALVGLTYASARELTATGVTANAIAPAYVVTPMIMEQLSEEDRNRQLAAIPVGRFCQPEEIAHSVRFLASPLAGFMTGTVIDMNGGLQFG